MSDVVIFLFCAILGVPLYFVWALVSRRFARADQRITADVDFLRAIPDDMDWGRP